MDPVHSQNWVEFLLQQVSPTRYCHAEQATLLIAKLDRLSRNAGFIFQLRYAGVDFVCCDMPDANTLTVGIFAVLAQHERETISKRTKDVLAQGAQLGTPANLTPVDTQKGRDQSVAKAHANEHNERAAAHILLLREKGFNYSQIAKKLNLLRFVTRYGKPFRAEQVKLPVRHWGGPVKTDSALR